MRLVFASLLALCAGICAAQGTYPAKPVRIIVTFTPGGAADFTARLVADKWSELWQQQVIVENRIGAGGNIGAEAVYKAPADGHTLLLVASAHAFNAALYPKLPFDIVLYKFQTKTDALHVPYRGCGPAVVDAVGGQIDVVMSSLTTVLPQAKAGKLRTLAITSENRSPSAPDIPTFRESGVPALKDYAVEVYYGLMARAGTPREVVAKLEADLAKVIGTPEFAQRISAAGI